MMLNNEYKQCDEVETVPTGRCCPTPYAKQPWRLEPAIQKQFRLPKPGALITKSKVCKLRLQYVSSIKRHTHKATSNFRTFDNDNEITSKKIKLKCFKYKKRYCFIKMGLLFKLFNM